MDIMMELSIICPLCSQPGFTDVNSLWLTLIRATTRQLTCPVCQEILCGLDKLTIHLVSHSLHDQLVQACLASNLSSPPTVLTKSAQLHGGSQGPVSVPTQESLPPMNSEVKDSAPSASYFVINFPSLQNVTIEDQGQVSHDGNFGMNISNEKSFGPSQGENFSTLLNSPALLSPKSDEAAASQRNTSLCMSHNIVAKMSDPLKPITFSQFQEESISAEGSTSSNEKNVSSTLQGVSQFDQTTSPQFMMQNSRDHELPNLQTSLPSPGLKLEQHSEASGSPISCAMCALTFKDKNIAMLHQQLIHNQNPPDINCQLLPKFDERDHCSKLSNRSKRGSVSGQTREVSGSPHRFPCHKCNKVFRMRGSLMVHLRVAHSPNDVVGLASRLGAVSTLMKPPPSNTNCESHVQNSSVLGAKESSTSKENACIGNEDSKRDVQKLFDQKDAMNESPRNINIINSLCEKVFPVSNLVHGNNAGSTKSPVSTISPTESPTAQAIPSESVGIIFPCNICNKTYFKETLLTQHLKSHDSKQWECDVCFKSFTTKYFLKKHKRLHTGEMPYTCGICSKSFTFQQSYHKHLLYHSDEKPHSCNECGRAFKELSTLHNHQRIHTGEKPWACETCGKCFRQRVSYLVHRRIHTGAMPYQCTICLKTFRYKVSQRTHKCVAQPIGDATSQSTDLLQQFLQPSTKEVEPVAGLQPSTMAESFKEPQMLLKEQLHPLNMKLGHQQDTIPNHLLRAEENRVLVKEKVDCFSLFNKCCNTGVSSLPTEHELTDSHANSNSVSLDLNEFLAAHARGCDLDSKPLSSHSGKSVLTMDKHLPSSHETHEGIDTSHPSASLSQSTPPTSSDFNIDLLQDLLSMVMSPSENALSPSTQMRHLSLAPGPNNEDLENGLELRQLLYGPCDSDTP